MKNPIKAILLSVILSVDVMVTAAQGSWADSLSWTSIVPVRNDDNHRLLATFNVRQLNDSFAVISDIQYGQIYVVNTRTGIIKRTITVPDTCVDHLVRTYGDSIYNSDHLSMSYSDASEFDSFRADLDEAREHSRSSFRIADVDKNGNIVALSAVKVPSVRKADGALFWMPVPVVGIINPRTFTIEKLIPLKRPSRLLEISTTGFRACEDGWYVSIVDPRHVRLGKGADLPIVQKFDHGGNPIGKPLRVGPKQGLETGYAGHFVTYERSASYPIMYTGQKSVYLSYFSANDTVARSVDLISLIKQRSGLTLDTLFAVGSPVCIGGDTVRILVKYRSKGQIVTFGVKLQLSDDSASIVALQPYVGPYSTGSEVLWREMRAQPQIKSILYTPKGGYSIGTGPP